MQIINSANMITIWSIVKLFFIIGLSIYLIFAFVVTRQIDIMTKTIKLKFEFPIKVLGIVHFLFALGLLIFTIFVL